MIKKSGNNQNLHTLIIEDTRSKIFIAHCLDMDIAAQGKTAKEAVSELKELMQAQIKYCLENNMLNTLFRSAPKKYWDKFYSSRQKNIIQQLPQNKRLAKELTSHLEYSYA